MIEVTGRSMHKVGFDTADPAEAILRFRNLFPGAAVRKKKEDFIHGNQPHPKSPGLHR